MIELPPGEALPVFVLAKALCCHRDHILSLIDNGELKGVIDLRSPGASRSLIRVPRASVMELLKSREIQVVESRSNISGI